MKLVSDNFFLIVSLVLNVYLVASEIFFNKRMIKDTRPAEWWFVSKISKTAPAISMVGDKQRGRAGVARLAHNQ